MTQQVVLCHGCVIAITVLCNAKHDTAYTGPTACPLCDIVFDLTPQAAHMLHGKPSDVDDSAD